MRIAQACGWYLPDSLGGTELYVAALAAELRRHGHNLAVAAPEVGRHDGRTYRHDEVEVFRYAIPAHVTRAQARGQETIAEATRFHRWLEAWQPDVVHFHTFVTGCTLPEVRAARATGARVIVTSHAASLGFLCERGTLLRDGVRVCDGAVTDSSCTRCALVQRGVTSPVADALARVPAFASRRLLALPGRGGTAAGMRALIAAKRVQQQSLFAEITALVVLSEWARQALIATGAPVGKVVLNRLGIAPPPVIARTTAEEERPLRAGFVGRAEAVKGVEDTVRAVTSLPATVPIQLQVVSWATNAAEHAVLAHCQRLAAADRRVSFASPVSPADVPRLLASFDVLLCPSRVVEGGPTVALEARAVGTPVIGARVPALTEIVSEGVDGALHAPGDWRQLAHALHDLSANRCATLSRWRAAMPTPRTHADVARDYLTLYAAS